METLAYLQVADAGESCVSPVFDTISATQTAPPLGAYSVFSEDEPESRGSGRSSRNPAKAAMQGFLNPAQSEFEEREVTMQTVAWMMP